MPIYHTQIEGEGKTANGKTVKAPPHVGLHLQGPVLQVSVTIEENFGKALLAQGNALPTPKTGFALIDTGATNTCIDEKAAQELGLPVIDVGVMRSANEEKPCNIYPVQFSLPRLVLNSPRTMGADLAPMGLLILIGRDMLRFCTLFYNGPAGQFTLSM